MKKTIVLLAALFIGMSHAAASDLLTIEDVLLRQGGVATIAIGCEFDTQFKGYQFDLELNGGLTLVLDNNDKPVWNNGFDGTDHTVSCTVVSEGKYRFVCVSTSNTPLPTSGLLLKLKVTGSGAMSVGDTFEGNVTAIEFTTLGTEVRDLPDASFSITIIDSRIILDENSTDVPEASEENAKVRVRRTINANEWSTICLPFAMTETQVKAAFGDDVQLGDFNNYEFDDEAGTINVKFANATAIAANHPYIIKVSEGMTEFTVDGVDIDPQEAIVDFDTSRRKNQPRQMVGTYVANTVLDWGTLFLNGNQFWYSAGNTKMKAFRAYFNFYDLLPDFENNYEARRISMSFDSSTDIRDNKRETMNNKRCYDLQGRRVSEFGIQNSELKKGVYIVNGKKYVNR